MASRSYSPLAKRSHSLRKKRHNRFNKYEHVKEKNSFYLRVVWELCQLVLDCEKISSLVCYEFVQIDKAIEEDANLCDVMSELRERKVTLCRRRLNHVVHLAEQVDEEDRLVVQVLKPVHLLLVEEVHLMWSNHAIIVQIDYFVPVL